MDLEMPFEKKIEVLKRIYFEETDENIRKIILNEIKEAEELINVRDELEGKNN